MNLKSEERRAEIITKLSVFLKRNEILLLKQGVFLLIEQVKNCFDNLNANSTSENKPLLFHLKE